MKVIDFRHCLGAVVVRSAHYKREHAGSGMKTDEIGVIVELTRHGAVLWPVVFWEGGTMGRTNHPANVSFYRRGRVVTYVEMES